MRILFILAFSFLSVIVYGIWKYIIKTQEKAEKERWQSLYEHDLRDSCYLQVYSKYSRREKIYNKQTKKIARVTFERFLNLYAVSPEKWIITTSSYEDAYHFPIYINDIKTTKKGKENIEEIAIPLYWENPEELKKYHTWIEEQYKKGEGAYFENERNQSLKQLVDYINDDLKAKREQTEKELAAIEEQFKQQYQKKESIPQLTLDQYDQLPMLNNQLGDVWCSPKTNLVYTYTKQGWIVTGDLSSPFQKPIEGELLQK